MKINYSSAGFTSPTEASFPAAAVGCTTAEVSASAGMLEAPVVPGPELPEPEFVELAFVAAETPGPETGIAWFDMPAL